MLKFQGGGDLKAKVLYENMNAKLEFSVRWQTQFIKPFTTQCFALRISCNNNVLSVLSFVSQSSHLRCLLSFVALHVHCETTIILFIIVSTVMNNNNFFLEYHLCPGLNGSIV